MSTIVDFYNHFLKIQMTQSQEEYVLSQYKRESVKKKTIIFREGDENTKHYIIEKGLVRLYIIDPKGKEINILFAKENQVIGDLATPQATCFFLETTEDSILYSIDDKGMKHVVEVLGASNGMENGLRRSYVSIQRRLVSILSKSAEENYLEFKEKYPDLIQRLPQYHIASYLGVSAEFLSKIIARTTKAN